MTAATHVLPQPVSKAPRRARRRLLATEAKLFLREPLAVFWGVVFPLILTIAMGLAGDRHDRHLGGLSLVDVYVPVAMAMAITIICVSVLPVIIVSYREKGILKRLWTTPLRPLALLGADVTVSLSVVLVAVLVIAAVGRVAFGAHLPTQGFGFALTLALTAVAMVALGALVASVATTTRISQALGTILFFPMMFFAGLWVPRQQMSSGLREVGDFTPLGAATAAIQDTMHGQWPGIGHLAVLAGYALVLSVAASRLFRWE